MAKPDFKIVIVDRETKAKTYAGGAWKAKYGGYSLQFGPGISLDRETLATVWIMLNPIEAKRDAEPEPKDEPRFWDPAKDPIT